MKKIWLLVALTLIITTCDMLSVPKDSELSLFSGTWKGASPIGELSVIISGSSVYVSMFSRMVAFQDTTTLTVEKGRITTSQLINPNQWYFQFKDEMYYFSNDNKTLKIKDIVLQKE
jgi:hypothetical protein